MRTILYLTALQASRRSYTFARFRSPLEAAGKPVKAALTATARKLFITLNAMLANQSDYTADHAIWLQLPGNRGDSVPGRL